MYQTEEITTITRKMIRLFDSPISLISEKSGLSRPTVSKFFNRKAIRPSNEELLYDVCLECIEEKENKRRSNLQKEDQLNAPFKKVKQTAMQL